MSSTTIVTRFAPSPTGYLHVGGARTALFNWLLARHTGGKFLLRIEDTDLARSTEEATRQLLEDLRWLGFHWDNAELVFQSKRLPIYNAVIDNLISRGLAYKAYETNEELTAQRSQAERAKRQYRYRRPALTDEQIRQYESEGRPHVVRFAMAVHEYRFDDAVLGPNQGFAAGEVQDFVIRKSDGMPTYHFGVVVDDEEMGITHVLRGQEHLLNTCNHIALQEALGYPRPIYAHLPVILNPETGEKLSKRDRDQKIRKRAGEVMRNTKKSPADLAAITGLPLDRLTEWLANDKKQLDLSEQPKVMKAVGLREADLPEIMVHDFRKNGYLPEVLNNFLALLGWSPGGDRERMSMEELVSLFSLDGIGKANAKFNRDKLLAFNTEACAAGSTNARMVEAMRDFLSVNPDSPLREASDHDIEQVLQMNHGFHILREPDDKSRFLFIPDKQVEYQTDALDKVLRKNESQGAKALREVRAALEQVEPWNAGQVEQAIKAFCDQRQIGLGKVAQPIRVAVSGSAVSPPIFETLEFLGRARTIARIDRCLSSL
ncbi:MAG TPA: glutamate--tRNA ligase [Tepidisphaeraceae bacterium]|jgi:glutamyl-tRNA synthetase|nr:glutamate--tRNA ligase [Tepidisphaeraceae bacterium]